MPIPKIVCKILNNMATVSKSKEAAEKEAKWLLIDVAGMPVGRAASKIATLLRGKHKVDFTPNINCGDFVVVVNAGKLVFTGKKAEDKRYYHHTGYIGGLKEIKAKDLLSNHPDRVVQKAVWGMLPKGPLGRRIIKRLKVVAGEQHSYTAQKPQKVTA